MLALLLNMLIILGIIVVGVLIVSVVVLASYAILYFIYRTFIDTSGKGGGRGQ